MAKLKEDKNNINIEKILQKKGLLTKNSIIHDVIENEAARQIGKIILASLFISGTVVIAAMAPNVLQGFSWMRKAIVNKKRQRKSKLQREKIMRTIYNLRNRKLIEFDRQGDKIILKITPQGKSFFTHHHVNDLKIEKQKKWDRIWRIVVFDIPNSKNSQRDALRDKLKNMGFYQFQKSAFLTPYPCKNKLEAVLEYYELFDYITYLEAIHISGEERCCKYFGI